MLSLPNVTLLCVETREPELAHWAISRCLECAQFSKVVLLTDLNRVTEKKNGIDYIQAPSIHTIKDYSDLLLTGIEQYVQGTHVLVIQWDSFIVHPELWTDDFLSYDYIGAVWPHHPDNPVGNGGFSLRSIKLLQAMARTEFIKRHPEDYCICVDNKDFLQKECGIRIAPVSLAERFAVERSPWHDAFGFHGFFNFAKVLDDATLEAFLRLLPESSFDGLDAYDLIASLRKLGRVSLAGKIAQKVRFKWKMRKHYFRLKLWVLGFDSN
jgi:hypothetical protein